MLLLSTLICGFSRLVVFMIVAKNNRSKTVLRGFKAAVAEYDILSRESEEDKSYNCWLNWAFVFRSLVEWRWTNCLRRKLITGMSIKSSIMILKVHDVEAGRGGEASACTSSSVRIVNIFFFKIKSFLWKFEFPISSAPVNHHLPPHPTGLPKKRLPARGRSHTT